MANRNHYNFDESKFKPKQREAAMLLVEREFADPKERKTKGEIADELKMTRQGLHKWETRDDNFIAYKNYLANKMMTSSLPMVFARILEGIDKEKNTKMTELYLKRLGELDTKSELTLKDGRDGEQTLDERRAALLARLGEEAEGDAEGDDEE
ncbi:phBC6A51 family helix-turn-helix protein [Virgibacillus proomii]|uniref:phBC6A51 family helix-turn-helix protein n=1 Tax=Virgibacillus proomii TaxID=84407 RepID=UPI001C1138DF|nr:phBC6A51 family helix-turn-helix protein [Virgibacillus proomii]MBU5266285.1 hypothetical protein [Virgibacillus proomii]